MKANITSTEIRHELNNVRWLQFGHLVIIMVCFIAEFFTGENTFGYGSLILGVALLIGYNFYFQAMKRLLYTFWTLSFFLFLYILDGLLENSFGRGHDALFYLYAFALIFLLVECYLISSPIFFPRVRWWEYDFRYRGDLPVDVVVNEEKMKGRLTDLRRGAGCVVMFREIPIGKVIKLAAQSFSGPIDLEAEIVSKREPLVGRGYTYGVKFLYEGAEEKKRIDLFSKYWKINSTARKRSKFTRKAP